MIDTMEIRKIMVTQKIKDAELARRIGKSAATVGRWLDNGDMPVKYAEIIAKELHIPAEQMMPIFFPSCVA